MRSSHFGSVVMNPASIHEDVGLIPGLAQWVRDPALLWLWWRPAATAPIRPLAWEPPNASGAALKSQKKKKKSHLRKLKRVAPPCLIKGNPKCVRQ